MSRQVKKVNISGKEDKSNKVTSWSSTTTDTNYPSEKLVKDSLDGKASSTHNHTVSNITDFPSTMTPSSHTHGNLQNNGQVGSTAQANKNVVTDSSGKITTENKPTIPSKTSDLTNDSGFLTSHQSLSGYLQTNDVKDNLTSTDTNKPLSANQGKELKTLIKSNATHTTTPNYILDDGWVIGFTYDYSGTDYQTSKIIVGDGTDNLSLTFNGNNLTIVDDATGDMWNAQIPFQAPHTMSLTVGSLANATESNGVVSYYITVTMDGYDNQFSTQYNLSQNETKEKYFRHYNCLREITSGYNSSITNLSITPTPKFSETINNKVSSWSSTTTDTHYPTEKLVKDSLDDKASSSHTHGNLSNDGKISTTSSATMLYFMGVGASANTLYKSNKLSSDVLIDDTAHSNLGTSANASQSTINSAIDTLIGQAITYINQ